MSSNDRIGNMHPLIRIHVLLTCCLMVSACDDPLPFMAGGALNGEVLNAPAVWQFDEKSGLAQLETRPEDPYSINLTYVQLDGLFYVYAGDTRTNWVQHIEQNPLVRIRVDGSIYTTRAIRVNTDEEIADFAAIWANLSVFQRDPTEFEEVWLYRLTAP